jgi:hypothetical protein
MAADLYPSDEYASDEVVAPSLSRPARALLAGWASDRRAVANRPSLRRLDDGTLLHIDEILDALKVLDSSLETNAWQNILAFSRSRPRRFWLRASSDGDDDPSPRPMALWAPRHRRTQRVMPRPCSGVYAVD